MAMPGRRRPVAWAMRVVIVFVMLSMRVTSLRILVRRSRQLRDARQCLVSAARGRYRGACGTGKPFPAVSPDCCPSGLVNELEHVGAVPLELLAADPADAQQGLRGAGLELGDQLER